MPQTIMDTYTQNKKEKRYVCYVHVGVIGYCMFLSKGFRNVDLTNIQYSIDIHYLIVSLLT